MFDALKYAVWQLFPLQQMRFDTAIGNKHRTTGVRPKRSRVVVVV